MDVRIGIIGGSGIDDPSMFTKLEERDMDTPYGKPSAPIEIGEVGGAKVAFIARHGKGHVYPPHRVPARANIWALKELGVERIIATCTCGSLKEDFHPGEIVVLDQFVDFTKSRQYSFYDDRTVHIGVADPFCPNTRETFNDEARALGIPFHGEGTYVCIEGPRFSTKAESRMYSGFADVVGMTIVPECVLAREKEMCYVSLANVTDYDVWKEHAVSIDMIIETMQKNIKRLQDLLAAAVPKLPEERPCGCKEALKNAVI